MMRILPGIVIPLVLLAAICLAPARIFLPDPPPAREQRDRQAAGVEAVQSMRAAAGPSRTAFANAPSGGKAKPEAASLYGAMDAGARSPSYKEPPAPLSAVPARGLFAARDADESRPVYTDRAMALSPITSIATDGAESWPIPPPAAGPDSAGYAGNLDRLSFTSAVPAALASRTDPAWRPDRAFAEVPAIPNLDHDLIDFFDSPAPSGRSGLNGVNSSQALANLTEGLGPQVSCPSSICSDPPPKGLMLFGRGKYYTEKQQSDWKSGHDSNYDLKNSMFGLGFMQDWSVNSTVGLAVDIMNAQVDAKAPGDMRRNNVRGWLLEGNLKTAVADKYPVDVSALFGRLRHDGEGTWGEYAWKEDEHKSMLYGVTGQIGVPLVFGDDIKLSPSAGFQLLALQSEAYQASTTQGQDRQSYSVGEQTSKSLAVPINIDVKKEYPLCYGMFTPQLNLGLIKEFSDSAMALRAFNSAAASTFLPGAGISPIDPSQSLFYKAGLGLELSTFGGWRIRADYAHYFASKYSNDTFRAEVSRCF